MSMADEEVLTVRGSQLLYGNTELETGPVRIVRQADSDLFLVQFILTGSGSKAKLQGSFNRKDWCDLTPMRAGGHSILPHPSGESFVDVSGFYYYVKVPTALRAVAKCAPAGHARCYA